MARTLGGIGQYLSGNIEGLVFVRRKGVTYMRAMPRKRKAGEWSEKQKEARNGFAAVIKYARLQKKYVIKPILEQGGKKHDHEWAGTCSPSPTGRPLIRWGS